MLNIKQQYSDLWRAIIRPPRCIYEPSKLGIDLQFFNITSSIAIHNKRLLSQKDGCHIDQQNTAKSIMHTLFRSLRWSAAKNTLR